jgi:sugar phosphate permease
MRGRRQGRAAPEAAAGAKRPRFYYGWVIVFVVGLTGIAGNTEFHPTIGAFIKPMTKEFGWTRSEFVGAISLGTLLGGVTALVIGPLLDRFGPRWILFSAFLVIGFLLVAMARVSELWQFYLVMGMGRLLVQGVANVASHVVVAKWFIRKRGRAVGFAGMGQRLGNGTVPPFAQAFISLKGWRTAAVALGILTWGLTLLPTSLLLRRQPEDMGLRPDGEPEEKAFKEGASPERAAPEASDAQETSFTLKETLRTRAFYLLLAATCGGFFVGAGFNLHALPYLAEQGISPGIAVTLVTAWSFIGSAFTLLSGFLAERVSIRVLMVGLYFTGAFSMFLASQINSIPMGFLFAVVYGAVFGTTATVNTLAFANYFGRDSLGAIRGFTTPFQMAFNALGPLIAALVFDSTGSYHSVLSGFMGMLALSGVFMLMTKPPQPPRRERTAPA